MEDDLENKYFLNINKLIYVPFVTLFSILIVILISLNCSSHSNDKAEVIYRSIADGASYKIDRTRATFVKNEVSWTIIGANAPIVQSYIDNNRNWPQQGSGYGIVVLSNPVTNEKILPWTENIINRSEEDVISLEGVPGENEPASFVIRSGDNNVNNISIVASDLKFTYKDIQGNTVENVIPRNNIDIKVVKCWYQSNTELFVKDNVSKTFTPELLLYNDSIVQVNHKYQVNLIKNFDNILDSPILEPTSLGKKENKQFWINVTIPDNAISGEYVGSISINSDNVAKVNLVIIVNVLPFRLDDPSIFYSMFYESEIFNVGEQFTIFSSKKTENQMYLELKDMRVHGIQNPTIKQFYNLTDLEKILSIRENAGFLNNTIYYVSWPGNNVDPVYLDELKTKLNGVTNYLNNRGIYDIYFYGVDEAVGDELIKAIPIYDIIKSYNIKTFVAAFGGDFFKVLRDRLDLPIIHGNPSRILLKKWVDDAHSMGKKVWIYGNPQCGREEPETYRRNFGLLLWKIGFDGACDYAYQAPMNNIWDDFDHLLFRDETMTYPTVNGIIGTIQWEGWREGVKDVKYMTTLYNYKEKVQDQLLKNNIEAWLGAIDVDTDLQEIRKQCIKYILQCIQSLKSTGS